MEVGRSLRAARAAVFAAACVGLSAAAHAWMSGAPIAAWALTLAVLAVFAAAYALGGRPRGFASIAGLMLVGELGLHLLFSAAQQTAAQASAATAWTPDLSRIKTAYALAAVDWLCGHGMNGARDLAAAGRSGGSSGSGTMAASPSMGWMASHGCAGMIGVHVAAGLLCAWWLRRGEAALFQTLRALADCALPLLFLVLPAARPVPDFTAVVPEDPGAHLPSTCRVLVGALVRRGPPAPAFSM